MIRNYKQFLFESISFINIEILESLVTSTDKLLKLIDAKEVNLFDTFKLNRDNFDADFDINFLYENKDFEKYLSKNELKKTELDSTEDFETFLEKTYDVRFFNIHGLEQSELEKPQYIILQSKPKEEKKWNPVRCYTVNNEMRKFYDEMTSKTIELVNGDVKFIYVTSNSGNDWALQNLEDKTNIYKDILTAEEIKRILLDAAVKMTVI
jgi:glutamate synthase domain-containing protein 1